MSLNSTPSAERVHIGIFGRTNAGKSTLINAVTGQSLAIVSDVAGTTTDPVSKAMELLPLGPVMIIDTAGLDDNGSLGQMRIKKTYQVLNKTDIAVLVIDANEGITSQDIDLLERIKSKKIPYIIVFNKCEEKTEFDIPESIAHENIIKVNALSGMNIYELKERIACLKPQKTAFPLLSDKVKKGDVVVLVTPIDSAAPKGRLILPQQLTIRELLDCDCIAVVCRESELKDTFAKLGSAPALVITDSQAFARVSSETPQDIPMTSFSILMARHKGNLEHQLKGADALDSISSNDKILISEGCTHHRQCGDIGTVKLPAWIKKYTNSEPEFVFSSGTEFPDDLSEFKMIIHCGGCMLNDREMKYRIKCAEEAGVPITNYGMCIAKCNGILDRSTAIFRD